MIDNARHFARAGVCGHVGLRCRANIELQFPRTRTVGLAAPEIERADFGQAGMKIDGNRLGAGRFLAGLQHGANRRQRFHLLRIDRQHFAGPSNQLRAGNIERKFHRLANQQIEPALRQVDFLAVLRAGRNEANGRWRFVGRFCTDEIGPHKPAAMRTPIPRRTSP